MKETPGSAAGLSPGKVPDRAPAGDKDAIILNPAVGQKLLTPEQAIDLINYLSGVLLVYERTGRQSPGIAKNHDHLPAT